jgi:DNA-binding IclR family transcriptional regulator
VTANDDGVAGEPAVAGEPVVGREPAVAGESAYADAAQIRSVHRAIELLRALGRQPGGATVSELALQLGMPKSSVYRLLVTLRRSDWVAFDPEAELYRLGIGLLEVSAGVLDRMDLRELARPHLLAILKECDESVHLGLLNDTSVIYALKFESTKSIRMVSEVGRMAPLYCTGLGKAMLAWMPGAEREALLKRIELRRFTDTTLTDAGSLDADLAAARTRGYTIDEGEHEDFVRCVGAPLLGPQGLVGSISVAAPAFRMTDDRVAELGALVSRHCTEISAELEAAAPWRARA